jgi:hypothetical protein
MAAMLNGGPTIITIAWRYGNANRKTDADSKLAGRTKVR